uniref:NTR domain-containing protein n=1 Tax=Strongyloides stercoralis TaxID=6248 RepID=A0AAF5I2K5_STRER
MHFTLILNILLVYVYVSFQCTCRNMTSKELYCQSDFVSKAKILDKFPKYPYNDTIKNQNIKGITYKVEHLEILKTDPTKPFPNEVITASNSALCGVNWLEIGKEYYLLGDQEKNSLFISLCSIINFNPKFISSPMSQSLHHKNVNVIEDNNSKVI